MRKLFSDWKGYLMTGISYMLPVVIGGSLVVAIPKLIGLCFGITNIDAYKSGIWYYMAQIEQIGWIGVGLINVILAAYAAYAIGGKPALAAGFIGGQFATNIKAGFIGALIAGFVAGYVAKWCNEKIKVGEKYQSIKPLIITPLLSTLSVAIIMALILQGPLVALNKWLLTWIKAMCTNGTSLAVLALIMDGMIGSDLGCPINKAAWAAGNVLLAEQVYNPAMITNVAIAGIPLGYAFATLFFKKRFSSELMDAGRSDWFMGFLGITEGAIPFTLVSPLKLIPLNIIAGAVGPAVAVLLGAQAKIPPVGGVYGFITVHNGWAYLVGLLVTALIIGVGAPLLVNFNDTSAETDDTTEESEEDIDITFE